MGFWDDLNSVVDAPYNFVKGLGSNPAAEQANQNARAGLAQNAGNAQGFAGITQGNYNQGTQDLRGAADYLRQIASGKQSVSAEQLRQALQQQQSQQRAMAAGASPMNQAMAARTAAINNARLGSGLAGQQAVAGLQERQAAQQALGNLLLQQRGQDLQGTLGGYTAANQGYGAMLNPTGDKTWAEKAAPYLSAAASGAALLSDRRHKTNVKDGDKKATRLLEGLRAHAYRYKDRAKAIGGDGEQLGVMAQDVEKVAPHAVVDTPAGKMIHAGKLAGSLAAAASSLHRRVKKLEGRKER